MPFKIGCPKCQHIYTLADDLRGKAIRCQKCSHAFRIPSPQPVAAAAPLTATAPRAAQPVAQRPAQPVAAAKPAAASNPRQAVNAPLVSDNDVFAGAVPNNQFDPLSNHVVQNPGFAYVDPAKYSPMQATGPDTNSLHYNPAVADLVAKVDYAKQEHAELTKQTWWPVFIALGAVGLTVVPGLIMLLVMPPMAILFLILACFVIGTIGGVAEIWILVLIYKYEPEQFMVCFFFAPLRYGFLSRNWEHHKDVGTLFLISVFGVFALIITFVAMGAFAG